MERLTTSMDQHGRMLIPSYIREMLGIHPGDKVTLEISGNKIKVINTDSVIDEMHDLFCKHHTPKNKNVVDDFINHKRKEYSLEEARDKKNV